MTTVLDRVIAELRSVNGPIRLSELAVRLGIAESALGGMVDLLVNKGVLEETTAGGGSCSSNACGTTCVGLSDCPFLVQTPTSYRRPSR